MPKRRDLSDLKLRAADGPIAPGSTLDRMMKLAARAIAKKLSAQGEARHLASESKSNPRPKRGMDK
jgi:hypothetical protein